MNSKTGPGSTHQRLIDAAAELFLKDGINATGIVAVAEHAGVSKMTLYAHFSSKDELIVAYLDQRNEAWNLAVDACLAAIAQPAGKLLGLFDLYREWLLKGNSRGCAYVNCAAEFPERDHPVRLAVARHKQSVRDHLSGLANAAGLVNPELVAQRLFLLLEGAFVTGALENDDGVFEVARQLAAELIQAR
jgi:AcrR family transcriptional regulator